LITNGSITGTNGQQAKIFADSLSRADLKTEVAITNQNCALAKLLWQNSNTPTLMLVSHGIDGITDKDNKACFVDTRHVEKVFWIYSTPYSFCSAGNKTWQDFLTPNTTHTVVIHPENKSLEFFKQVAKRYQTNIKTIKVNTSNVVSTMVKAGEVDFVFRSGISEFEIFKDKCFWSSLSPTKDLSMAEFLPEWKELANLFTVNGYLIGKNISSTETKDLVSVLHQALNSSEMTQLHQRRNYNNDLINFTNYQEYLDRMRQLQTIISVE
jgi:hypothetical protein